MDMNRIGLIFLILTLGLGVDFAITVDAKIVDQKDGLSVVRMPTRQKSSASPSATPKTNTGDAVRANPTTQTTAGISFKKQVAPILLEQCVDCHNAKKSKGGYSLDSFDRLLQTGDSNHAPIKPGKPEDSELYRLIMTIEEEDRMPKKAPALGKSETEIIRQWIEQGAKFDATDRSAALASYSHAADHPNAPKVYAKAIPITAIAYSPDGNQLALGGYHEVILWDLKSAKLDRRIQHLPESVYDLCYSPDGNSLAIATGNPGRIGEAWLADVKTGERGKLIKRTRDVITAVVFSHDGKRLAIGGADNAIDLYTLPDLQKPLHITQHTDWISQLSFNPEGNRIASASRDKSARIIDCKTGDSISAFAGHAESVLGIAWANNGNTVFTTGHDKMLLAWKPDDAKEVGKISGFELDPLRPVTMDDRIYVPCADGIIREYAMSDRDLVRVYPRNNSWIYCIAIDPKKHRLAIGTGNGQIVQYNADNGKEIARFNPLPTNGK